MLAALLASTGCDRRDFLDPAPPTRTEDVVVRDRRPLSTISVPMRIPVDLLTNLVDEAVPVREGDLETFHPTPDGGRATVAFELERTPFRAVVVGDVARLSATVMYRVRVQYDLPLLPDVDSECGTGPDPRPALFVAIESPMSIDAEWRLRTRARVAELRPASSEETDRCSVSVLGIDVTDRIVGGARAFLEGQLPRIDSIAATVDTRSRFVSWWETLREPVALSDSLWLAMGPESITRGPVVGSGDTVTVELGLRSRPRIVFGARPAVEPAPLPPLDSGSVEPELDLLVDARAEYRAASRFLNDALGGQTLEMAGRSIRVDSVDVYGIGNGKLALQVRVSGDLRGRLYLTGRPSIDRGTGRVSVPDLELDVATHDLIVAAASWVTASTLNEYLRRRATWPTAPAVEWLATWLERGLNRPLSRELRVEGVVRDVEIVGATAQRDALWVRIAATGSASLFVQD